MAIEKKRVPEVLGVERYLAIHAGISAAVDKAKTVFSPENLKALTSVVDKANTLVVQEVSAHSVRDLIAYDWEQFSVRVFKDPQTGLVKGKDHFSVIPVHLVIFDKMNDVQKSRLSEAMRQAVGFIRRQELKEEEEEAFSKTKVKSALQELVNQLFPDAGLLVKSVHVNSVLCKLSNVRNKESKFVNNEKTFLKIFIPALTSIVLDEPIAQVVPKWDK